MSLTARQQLLYWSVGLVGLLVLMYLLADTLFPFIVSGAIAYLLDPVADRLERLLRSRIAATAILLLLIFLAIIGVILIVTPILVYQFTALSDAIPVIIEQLRTFLQSRFPTLLESSFFKNTALSGVGEYLRSQSGSLMEGVYASVQGALGAAIFVVVVPVVTFYLLLDWDRMVAKLDSYLPLDHADTIRELIAETDRVLAGFVRGQLTVCAVLGSFYGIALMAVGLEFGLVVGFLAGALSFIPFVGSIGGGLLSIGLAVFQFWNEPIMIGVVAFVFVFGQLVEQNYLTPKLVGSSVGLHPVWLLLALSAFASLYGFVGMLIAVPAAAVIGVFFGFGLKQYKAGRLYQGQASAE